MIRRHRRHRHPADPPRQPAGPGDAHQLDRHALAERLLDAAQRGQDQCQVRIVRRGAHVEHPHRTIPVGAWFRRSAPQPLVQPVGDHADRRRPGGRQASPPAPRWRPRPGRRAPACAAPPRRAGAGCRPRGGRPECAAGRRRGIQQDRAGCCGVRGERSARGQRRDGVALRRDHVRSVVQGGVDIAQQQVEAEVARQLVQRLQQADVGTRRQRAIARRSGMTRTRGRDAAGGVGRRR